MRSLHLALLLAALLACSSLTSVQGRPSHAEPRGQLFYSWWQWLTSPFYDWEEPPKPAKPVLPPNTLTILTPLMPSPAKPQKPDEKPSNASQPEKPKPNPPSEPEKPAKPAEPTKPAEPAPAVRSEMLLNQLTDPKNKESRLEKDEGEPLVTVFCNDQTCTTTTCPVDGSRCTKKVCNIYDTNMKGECQQVAHLQMGPGLHTGQNVQHEDAK